MINLKILLWFQSFILTALAQDTVYAVYIFHRHGDRTPKAIPPTVLTSLGYNEVLSAGTYFHNRYVTPSSPLHIAGLSSPTVKNAQLSVSAPLDTVLLTSTEGFLQGFYPPVGVLNDTLANGTVVTAPMNGFQLIPISIVSSGTGSESNGWLQDASGCGNAVLSSNTYFSSAVYKNLLNSTQPFFTRIDPVVNATFASSAVTYKNAYSIFDVINVARIHNQTIPSGNLLDPATVLELQVLANEHEYGLAYNASDNARAMPGMQLAGEILTFFNASITGKGASKVGIQFGAYASFLSYFGLAGLPNVNVNFTGIPDYASAMVFELFATGTNASAYPSPDDLKIRFFFSNGSTGVYGDPTAYPAFNGSDLEISWSDFSSNISAFAVTTTDQWCKICGNTTGVCASAAGPSSSGQSSSNHKGMSLAVAGVIGAMVTLGVILGLEALIALVAGLRVVRKGSRVASPGSPTK